MKYFQKMLFIITAIIILSATACSGTYNITDYNEEIEVFDGELDENDVQGSSYTIATNKKIDVSDGDIDSEYVAGSDIDVIIEKNEPRREDARKEEQKNVLVDKTEDDLTLEKDNSNNDDIYDNKYNNNEKVVTTSDNSKDNEDAVPNDDIVIRDANGDKVSIENEDEESGKDITPDEKIINDLMLYHNEDSEFNDSYKNKDGVEEEIMIEDNTKIEDTKPVAIEPIPITGSLGQIFTLDTPTELGNSMVYLFLELLPAYNQSAVELGKDALKMLLNSINLITKGKDKIGAVNYVVIGVEMYPDDVWYFIASVGDLLGFLRGQIDIDQLTERITIKKGMPNVFEEDYYDGF